MSERYVYLVDADANLNAHLVGELGRYGFRVDAEVDSNELMQRKDDLPALIVLCIDPKRTGWAVCNRLRKSATLKSTPLIEYRMRFARSLEETLGVLMALGDDRAIRATYAAGRKVHDRDG